MKKEVTLAQVLAEIQELRREISELRQELRKDESPGKYLTVEEAARYIRLSPKTIRNRLSDKNRPFPVKPCRKGRKGRILFKRDDLDTYINSLIPE